MEPASKSINLNGIDRSKSYNFAKDGDMDEAINLRKDNGSFVPTGDYPVELKKDDGSPLDISSYDKIYIHKTVNYKHYLALKNETIYYLDETNDYEEVAILENVNGYPTISFLKNTISISWDSETDVFHTYLFWNGTKYEEQNISSIFPNIRLTRRAEGYIDTGDVVSSIDTDSGASEDTVRRVSDFFNSVMNQNIYNLKISGYLPGHFTWRYAIKLFDGTYINHSPLFYSRLFTGGYERYHGVSSVRVPDFWSYTVGGTSGVKPLYLKINAQIYKLRLLFKADKINDLSTYKDIIDEVCIFVSSPVNPYIDSHEYISKIWDRIPFGDNFIQYSRNIMEFIAKTGEILTDEVMLKYPLYKVASFSVDELTGSGQIEKTITGVNFQNLESFEVMPDDNSTRSVEYPLVSYVYNSKNHIADIRSKLFSGFPLGLYQEQPFEGTNRGKYPTGINVTQIARIVTKVYIKTDGGEAEVVKETDLSNIYRDTTPDYFYPNPLSPLITYPDSRAYKMEVVFMKSTPIEQLNANTTSQAGTSDRYEIILKPHPNFNLAYSFGAQHAIPYDAWTTAPENYDKPRNEIELRGNILKVSEVDNLFTFPVENTYVVGSGNILALSSNTKAISTGQFGEYPLLAFCSDGIYALGIGNGEVDYSSIKPLSRDVCNNPNSVTQVDNAVVFSSERGLLAVSGDSVINLSESVQGNPFLFATQGLNYIDLAKKAISNDLLVNFPNAVSKINFSDYLKNAEIGFVYGDRRELVISNKDYEYSYLYSLDNKSWSKIDKKIQYFINDYPELYASMDNFLKNITKEQNTEVKQTFFLTSPVKLGSINFKEGYRSVLRSLIRPTGTYAGFYVFGSEDGILWRFLGGTEFDGKIRTGAKVDFIDLGCTIERIDVKYIRFAFVGKVKFGTKLDFIEISSRIKNSTKIV